MSAHVLAEALDRQSRRDGGVPHTYYALLVILYEAGAHRLRMSELAAELRCSSSRLTHAVSSLERSGLVERQYSDCRLAETKRLRQGHIHGVRRRRRTRNDKIADQEDEISHL